MSTVTLMTVTEQIDAWWRERGLTAWPTYVTWQQVLEEVLRIDETESEPSLFRFVDEALRVHGFARKRVLVGDARVWAWVRGDDCMPVSAT